MTNRVEALKPPTEMSANHPITTLTGCVHSVECNGAKTRWKLGIARPGGTVDYRLQTTNPDMIDRLRGLAEGTEVTVSVQMARCSAPGDPLTVTTLELE